MRIGDVAVIDAEPVELPNGRLDLARARQPPRLVRRARGGAAGGARPAARAWELAAVAAAQEETTFGGSRTSAFSLEPDAAIVVDVTHATDAPGHRRQGAPASTSSARGP